jgi:glycine cleavage system aminomethyltransferase T
MHSEYRPDEAGVGFAVKLGKGPFIGREALQAHRQAQEINSTSRRRLCCLHLTDPTVVVMGKEPVLRGEEVLGYVTSAGFGYSTGESLAYAYLPTGGAEEGTVVEVEYFGERFQAVVVSEPRWDPEGARLRV